MRQVDCRLCGAARAHLTFSRMWAALAVKMNGLGFVVMVDVFADGLDPFLDTAKGTAPEPVFC